jgi:uncharacterized membrane protein
MQELIDTMTARERVSSRPRLAVAATVVVAALAASPASADPPPTAAGTTSHGFLAQRGVLTPIDHPRATTVPAIPSGQAGTATLGINDRGQVLGNYEGRDGIVRPFVRDRRGRSTAITMARLRPPGQYDEYVDINNRGAIVGFYNDEQGATTTGFLRTTKGRFVDIDVPGATATIALGINNRGQMVGSSIDPNGAYHGFLRNRKGTVTTLPEAPGSDPASGGTQPCAINERGQIAGLVYDAQGGSRGFLFKRGRFTMIDGPAAVYTRAIDINNRGQIVGDYGTRPRVATDSVRSPTRPIRSTVRRLDLGRGLRLVAGGGRTR